MEVEPPYVISRDEGAEPGLSVTRAADSSMIEIAVRGRWSRRLCLDVHALLRGCLAEHPSAIIIDLHELGDLDGASAGVWLANARAASAGQPATQLVLTMPPTRQLAGRLRRLGAVRHLRIFVTIEQARAAVAGRMLLTDRLYLSRLRPELASADAAGDLVTVACDAWGLPNLVDSSRRVMSALVTNAVEHTGTDMAVTVSRRGAGIYLGVRDGDPRLPYVVDRADDSGVPVRGYGERLRVVDARASAWGAVQSHDGKVVWAIVRPVP
ncbi:ATP-binding protein [Actinoplanes sp. NPDC026623]|uniref:ATP-binding protein n=1 Tax=Actinoplanes sp. NPDC026623 TaxID=3155610 RepID=UPI0033D42B87